MVSALFQRLLGFSSEQKHCVYTVLCTVHHIMEWRAIINYNKPVITIYK